MPHPKVFSNKFGGAGINIPELCLHFAVNINQVDNLGWHIYHKTGSAYSNKTVRVTLIEQSLCRVMYELL